MRLEDIPREWLVAGAAVLAGYAFWLRFRLFLRRSRMRARFERGAAGEREASALLAADGFVVHGAQVVGGYSVRVDGRAVPIEVRADYLVTRGGQRFVAEVKTGKAAPRIESSATRRQLLDYQYAFDVDGILLVDADARTIQRIEFPTRESRGAWAYWAFAAVLAFAASAWAYYS